MSEQDEIEEEKTVRVGRLIDDKREASGGVKFPEIRGLCRTCSNAVIRRRQYSEVPEVFCQAFFDRPHRVPLDITECSSYRRAGEMTLREMHGLAILLDPRKLGGQYL